MGLSALRTGLVRLDGEAFSTCWAHCSVLMGGQGHSCVQLTSQHARVALSVQQLWLDLRRCITNSRSSFPEPGLLKGAPQSPGPGASPQGPMRGQLLWQGEPCGCSPCCMTSAPDAHQPAQLTKVPPFAVGAFGCDVPSCQSALPSPFAWKRRGRKEISHKFGI